MFSIGWTKAVFCISLALALSSCVIVSNNEAPKKQQATVHLVTNAFCTTKQVRGASVGTRQLFATFYSISPECENIGYPSIRNISQPAHGTISVEEGTSYPNFPSNGPRAKCNAQAVPSTQAYYTSAPDFTGTDTVEFDVIFHSGQFAHCQYEINVR